MRPEPPAVLALLSDPAPARELGAGFEEEGVPIRIEHVVGCARDLARMAARRSQLGIGIGGDADTLVVALGAGGESPYVEARAGSARGLGHTAARIAARRPLRAGDPGSAEAT